MQQREAPVPLYHLNSLVPIELSDAVAVAIDTEPERRPEDALEFAELLRDGASGISPFDEGAPTRMIGSSGDFTRVLPPSGREQPTSATRVSRPPALAPPVSRPPAAVPVRPARPVPPARIGSDRIRPAPRRRGGFSRFLRRVALTLLVLLVIAGAIAAGAVYLANQANKTVVHYEKVVASDTQGAINSVRSLISHYTK